MSGWARFRRPLLVIMAVILLVASAGATTHYRERITALERRLLELLAPVQRAATETGRSLRALLGSLSELRRLREDNAQLRRELERLTALVTRMDEIEEQNDRLRQMLDFLPDPGFESLAATVIGRNLSNWFSCVEIDKGTRHGVALNCAVVTQRGLVGRVVRVTEFTATVMLIVDPQSGLGALVVRSREPGVVLGSASFSETCGMRLFSRDADVVLGDTVLTSGLGDVFPAGLHVGQVADVRRTEQGLVVVAEVAPAADLGRLEEVFVLRPR